MARITKPLTDKEVRQAKPSEMIMGRLPTFAPAPCKLCQQRRQLRLLDQPSGATARKFRQPVFRLV